MRKWIPYIIILILTAGFITVNIFIKPEPKSLGELLGQSENVQMGNKSGLEGKSAPDFSGHTLDGREFRLSEHIGDKMVVLLFFMPNASGKFKDTAEALNEFYKENKDEPLLVLGVSLGYTSEIRSVTQYYGLDFPIVLLASEYNTDSNAFQRILAAYGVNAMNPNPVVVINTDGEVDGYYTSLENADVFLKKALKETKKEIAR